MTPTIMVVDDAADSLRFLDVTLRQRGYRVSLFADGMLALKAARRVAPDLILLDVNMRGLDGFEICEWLKADESTREIPVIFLSSRVETLDKVRAFVVGGVDYICKPLHFEELHARVRTHLEIRRLHLELKEKYVRLAELERFREDLSNMVVHDLRTHLQGVLMFAHALQNEPDSTRATVKLAAQGIESVARTLSAMTDNLLDLARLEERRLPIRPRPCDLRDVAREAVTSLGPLGFQHDLQLVLPDDRIDADLDPDLVRRVIANLLANAYRFTPHGGGVSLRACSAAHEVRVEVVDQGVGIPAGLQERVFDRFGQVTPRAGKPQASVGLGLAFCKLAVEALGGRIGVDSVEGQGSTFWFELPRLSAAGTGTGRPAVAGYARG